MSDDIQLLERAARAAGLPWAQWVIDGDDSWNPLENDGDAFRLAVKLHMTVRCYMGTTVAQIGVPGEKNAYEQVTNHAHPATATRRAIVLAAAEIGKAHHG